MRQKCLEGGYQQTDGMTPKNGNKKLQQAGVLSVKY